MSKAEKQSSLSDLWAHHHGEWRDPSQVVAQWPHAEKEASLHAKVYGAWWESLAELEITLLISREYEHFVLGMSIKDGEPFQSYLSLPHPSGMVYDKVKQSLYLAATRNPNQVYEFKSLAAVMGRSDMFYEGESYGQLMPIQSRFYAGSLYIHDLAIIDGRLYANSVGQNAIVELVTAGDADLAWWPKSIEEAGKPRLDKNYIQLNSIAAGDSLETSYFSASCETPSHRRPGHLNFPVDGRGVIFEGKSREVIARGLTRPHSARLHEGKLYVANSGYGTVGLVEDGVYRVINQLLGWTRGLVFCNHIAFIGTSRVIPRFRQYAPGLDSDSSICGVHAIDMRTGEILGGITWENGNQIFALEVIPRTVSLGFPFNVNQKRYRQQERQLFYTYQTKKTRTNG